jgi:hypothetical protein
MTFIVKDEGYTMRDLWEDNEMAYFLVFDDNGVEVDESDAPAEEVKAQLERFLNQGGRSGRKTRKRKVRQGGYVTCKWIGNKVGAHPETIRKEFLKEKNGVIKRTTSGRNRKTYTVLRVSLAALKRHYPDLEI